MPRWRFWEKDDEPAGTPTVPQTRPRTAIVGSRPHPPEPGAAPMLSEPERQRRIAALRRRREAILFDVERAELALQPENPWQERITLLDDALGTVAADRQRLAAQTPGPTFPIPPIPISDFRATNAEPAEVSFRIGDELFDFAEDVDWDERGGAVLRGQLRQIAGDASRLVPINTPPDLRTALAQHLTDSVVAFATDLRDRALAGKPMPAATLTDLAQPCPECGGWRDWHGRCPACLQRDWRRRQLDAEAQRLRGERAKEAEERHRWAERLPVARKRLADVDAEIAALGGTVDGG